MGLGRGNGGLATLDGANASGALVTVAETERELADKLDEIASLKDYADSKSGNDWAPALTAALAANTNVKIPFLVGGFGFDTAATVNDDNRIYFDPGASIVANSATNLLNCNAVDNVGIYNPTLVGAATGSSNFNNAPILCKNCTKIKVFNYTCTRYAGSSIAFEDSSECLLDGFDLSGAVFGATHVDNSKDIAIWGNCSDNLVKNGVIRNGGIGLTIRVRAIGEISRRNKYENIDIYNAAVYFGQVYLIDDISGQATLEDNEIFNCRGYTCTGQVTNGGNKIYGAGWYNQGGIRTRFTKLYAKDTCQQTDSETLVPAGIASTNGSVIIDDCEVEGSVKDGIVVEDINAFSGPNNESAIRNSSVSNSARDGIKINNIHNVEVTNVRATRSGERNFHAETNTVGLNKTILLEYTESTAFAVDEVVTGGTSGGEGTIVKIEKVGNRNLMFLKGPWAEVGIFQNAETLTGGGSGAGASTTATINRMWGIEIDGLTGIDGQSASQSNLDVQDLYEPILSNLRAKRSGDFGIKVGEVTRMIGQNFVSEDSDDDGVVILSTVDSGHLQGVTGRNSSDKGFNNLSTTLAFTGPLDTTGSATATAGGGDVTP